MEQIMMITTTNRMIAPTTVITIMAHNGKSSPPPLVPKTMHYAYMFCIILVHTVEILHFIILCRKLRFANIILERKTNTFCTKRFFRPLSIALARPCVISNYSILTAVCGHCSIDRVIFMSDGESSIANKIITLRDYDYKGKRLK